MRDDHVRLNGKSRYIIVLKLHSYIRVCVYEYYTRLRVNTAGKDLLRVRENSTLGAPRTRVPYWYIVWFIRRRKKSKNNNNTNNGVIINNAEDVLNL